MLLLSLAGCASHSFLAPEERGALVRDYAGTDAQLFLKLSYFVTPFFGDSTKRLLTALPPEELPTPPGPVEAVLPAGTRVRILRLEFPTGWSARERSPATPRTQPWVFLRAVAASTEVPLVLVLRDGISSRDEFHAEMERYLCVEDPARELAAWPETVQQAIREKAARLDMSAEALERAWGYPATKEMSFDGTTKNEVWIYPGGKRRAQLVDGRVSQLDDPR